MTESFIPPPDESAPLALGMWRISYRLPGNGQLWCFRGGTRDEPPCGDRVWGLSLLQGNGQRDRALEEALFQQPSLRTITSTSTFGGEAYFTTTEARLGELVAALRQLLLECLPVVSGQRMEQ